MSNNPFLPFFDSLMADISKLPKTEQEQLLQKITIAKDNLHEALQLVPNTNSKLTNPESIRSYILLALNYTSCAADKVVKEFDD